jgi:integrase
MMVFCRHSAPHDGQHEFFLKSLSACNSVSPCLRACDLVAIKVEDVCLSGRVRDRAIIIQRKTGRPVQFEITETTRRSVQSWIDARKLSGGYLFPSRHRESPHLSRHQYARIVDDWVEQIGLDPTAYGTHSMRRTKAAQIYKKTGNLRAVQLLLGHYEAGKHRAIPWRRS